MRKSLIIVISLLTLWSAMSWGTDGDQKSYDRSVFSFPESKAVEALLLKSGKTQLLRETQSVGISKKDDFATSTLITGKGEARKKIRFYVFKESGKWTAYATLPTHKDSLHVFRELATDYLTQKRGKWTGASFADDSWQNKNKKQRVIKFFYTEAGKGILISLTFTFTREKGWHITAAH